MNMRRFVYFFVLSIRLMTDSGRSTTFRFNRMVAETGFLPCNLDMEEEKRHFNDKHQQSPSFPVHAYEMRTGFVECIT